MTDLLGKKLTVDIEGVETSATVIDINADYISDGQKQYIKSVRISLGDGTDITLSKNDYNQLLERMEE